MTNKQLLKQLRKLEACAEAVEWVGKRDLATAWAECERADWLLWLAGNMAGELRWPSRKEVILTAIECGRTSLRYAGKGRKQLEEVYEVATCCVNDPSPENRAAARTAAEAAWAAAEAAPEAAAQKQLCKIIRKRLLLERGN